MTKRKTFSIAQLIADVNRKNRLSTCDPQVRQGWNSLLESILHEANVYAGFGYLEAEDLNTELVGLQKPGIAFCDKDGETLISARQYYDSLNIAGESREEYTKTFPDESRRHYYADPSISKQFQKIITSEAYLKMFQ